MTLQEFKMIFFWEWAHRVLARSVGLVYGVPLVVFWRRGYFSHQKALMLSLVGILGLGGCQGALGWYMVKSGLDPRLLDEHRKATVSAARLAAHLTLAFVIYSSMMRIAFGLRKPALAFEGKAQVQLMARAAFSIMFCTAVSGAFVAGLDAGLMYNDEFPLMGGGVVPPTDHMITCEPLWRNMFENPACAQLWHRVMAGATTASIVALNVAAKRLAAPRAVRKGITGVNHALFVQLCLGMATIISYVDIPIAAAHQAGSILLLTMLIRLCATIGSRGVVL
jgi:cytochrome c oxidase assembly protein subunit 15